MLIEDFVLREAVIVNPAVNFARDRLFLQVEREQFQNLVAFRNSVDFIYKLEVADVGTNYVVFFIRIRFQHERGFFVKRFLVVNSRKQIVRIAETLAFFAHIFFGYINKNKIASDEFLLRVFQVRKRLPVKRALPAEFSADGPLKGRTFRKPLFFRKFRDDKTQEIFHALIRFYVVDFFDVVVHKNAFVFVVKNQHSVVHILNHADNRFVPQILRNEVERKMINQNAEKSVKNHRKIHRNFKKDIERIHENDDGDENYKPKIFRLVEARHKHGFVHKSNERQQNDDI